MREPTSASFGSTSRRASSWRIIAANDVPHTAQTSSSIGLSFPHDGHGQVGAARWRRRASVTGAVARLGRRVPVRASGVGIGLGGRDIRLGPRTGSTGRTSRRRRSPARRSSGHRRDRRSAAAPCPDPCAPGYPRTRAAPGSDSAGGAPGATARGVRRSAATCGRARPARDPPAPIARARSGSPSRSATASATALDVGAVDEQAGLAVDERLARAAGVAHHHRACAHAAASMNTLPQPSTSRPGEPGPARHREHVARRRSNAGRSSSDTCPREDDRIRGRGVRQLAQRRLVRDRRPRSAAPRPGTRRSNALHPADQHVLTLARHQPAHAHDQRTVADPVSRPQVRRSPGRDGTLRRRRPGTAPRPARAWARPCARCAR